MPAPEFAKTREVLQKRVRRLLDLEGRVAGRSELSLEIIPFLRSLGSVALIGGAIRDVARAGKKGFSSDLDFVIYRANRGEFIEQMVHHNGNRNRFGGYALTCFKSLKIDVWHIEDTWAHTAGLTTVRSPADLLRCTFFDWDSVVYELDDSNLILPEDYFRRLLLNVMDIQLEENPNPTGSLVRALRRAALWHVKFGPRLTAFCRHWLKVVPWEDLVSLDASAFPLPVLRYLSLPQLLQHLESPTSTTVGEVTLPVPAAQLSLAFSVEETTVLQRF